MGYGQYTEGTRGKQNPLRHETVKARRQVFPTGEIPHKWAHQTQEAARNAQGNLYFKGPTIYSYRDSWPLARIYTRLIRQPGKIVKGINYGMGASVLVLTNSGKYGSTTAGHQYAVNTAVRHLNRIAVPHVEHQYSNTGLSKDEHDRNLKHLADKQARLLEEASRAMTEKNVSWRATAAGKAHRDYCDYMIFFGIRRKAPALLSFAAAFERARRIAHPDPIRDARKFKQRAARQAAKQTALQGEFSAYCATVETWNAAVIAARPFMVDVAQYWRDNGRWPGEDAEIGAPRPYAGWKQSRRFESAGFRMPSILSQSPRAEGVLLRIDGAQIETSMGARIPADHAPRIWGVVQKVMARGEPYQHNGHSEHAGDFRIDRIDVDGTLTAGCHTIAYSELAAMARQLGLS